MAFTILKQAANVRLIDAGKGGRWRYMLHVYDCPATNRGAAEHLYRWSGNGERFKSQRAAAAHALARYGVTLA